MERDHYTFLGRDVVVCTDSPEVTRHLRECYGNFLCGETSRTESPEQKPPRIITVKDEIATSRVLELRDDFHAYSLRCKDIHTLDLDYYGSATVPDPLAFVQWMVLDTVARLATDYCMLHAGAVSWQDKGLVLPAPSGRGKTTLTLKLVLGGFRFLSDEVACIRFGSLHVQPFFRALNLDDHSLNLLENPCWPGDMRRRPQTNEWVLDIASIPAKSLGGPCPLRCVVFLETFGDEPRLSPLDTLDVLPRLPRLSLRSHSNPTGFLFDLAPLFGTLRCYSLVVGPPDKTADLLQRLMDSLPAPNASRQPLAGVAHGCADGHPD
jgi:hypothetical protein